MKYVYRANIILLLALLFFLCSVWINSRISARCASRVWPMWGDPPVGKLWRERWVRRQAKLGAPTLCHATRSAARAAEGRPMHQSRCHGGRSACPPRGPGRSGRFRGEGGKHGSHRRCHARHSAAFEHDGRPGSDDNFFGPGNVAGPCSLTERMVETL